MNEPPWLPSAAPQPTSRPAMIRSSTRPSGSAPAPTARLAWLRLRGRPARACRNSLFGGADFPDRARKLPCSVCHGNLAASLCMSTTIGRRRRPRRPQFRNIPCYLPCSQGYRVSRTPERRDGCSRRSLDARASRAADSMRLICSNSSPLQVGTDLLGQLDALIRRPACSPPRRRRVRSSAPAPAARRGRPGRNSPAAASAEAPSHRESSRA
jgi:hypothetical protein